MDHANCSDKPQGTGLAKFYVRRIAAGRRNHGLPRDATATLTVAAVCNRHARQFLC